MKIEDCWRLAKVSLRARKKATKTTVCGIAVSLIIIIPLIFAILGVNLSIKKQLNAYPEVMFATYKSTQAGFKFDEDININNSEKLGNSYDCPSSDKITDRIKGFEQFENEVIQYVSIIEDFDCWKGFRVEEKIAFNGVDYPLRKFENIYEEKSELAIVSKKCLSQLTPNKLNIADESLYKGFTGDGARQVILSERYLAMAGLKPIDVFGKKIAIKMVEKSSNDNFLFKASDKEKYLDRIDFNLLQNFEVVGIIKSNNGVNEDTKSGYDNIFDKDHRYYAEIENANIIVSSASYYGENGKPAIAHDYYIDNNKIVCDFGDINSKNAMTEDYVFCGAKSYNSYLIYADKIGTDYVFTGKMMFLEVNRFKFMPDKNCTNAFDKVSEMMEKIYPIYSDEYPSALAFKMSDDVSPIYLQYVTIELFIKIILSILSIFSIVILVVALINLFNTILHSVKSRKNYLGVLRAIGARSSDIPKLYLFEIIRLLSRALVWIVALGSVLCIIIKVIIDKTLTEIISLSIKGIVIAMPWYLIPIIMLAFAIMLFIVGIIYAIGCSYKVAHNPIVKSLES